MLEDGCSNCFHDYHHLCMLARGVERDSATKLCQRWPKENISCMPPILRLPSDVNNSNIHTQQGPSSFWQVCRESAPLHESSVVVGTSERLSPSECPCTPQCVQHTQDQNSADRARPGRGMPIVAGKSYEYPPLHVCALSCFPRGTKQRVLLLPM